MAFNDGKCLCVRGLAVSSRGADLDSLFRSFGQVDDVHIPVDPVSKAHRGYAFVTMGSPAEAQACIAALNGAELSGCAIIVEASKRSAPHVKTPGIYLGSPQLRDALIAARGGSDRGRGGRHRRHEPSRTTAAARARSGGRVSPRCAADEDEKDVPLLRSASCHQGMAEPLSEPAASAPAAAAAACCRGRGEPLVEPVTEPGGEPLIEEDPLCCDSGKEAASKLPPESPRSRISKLEDANIRVFAKQTVDNLLLQFQRQGFSDARAAAHECLRVSMEVLGVPVASAPMSGADPGVSLQSPPVLLSPDEFKNPSSFLRVYGDPLAVAPLRRGHCQPESHQDGNWRCEQCSNVNFPRRQRCHKCQSPRGPGGDAIVLQYCLRVYEMLVKGKA